MAYQKQIPKGIKIMTYTNWEQAVIQTICERLSISFSDASAIVEAQPFYMQQSWGLDLDTDRIAAKVLTAAMLGGVL